MNLTEFLDKIDETARAATTGPWVTNGTGNIPNISYYGDSWTAPTKDEIHIARMDPPTTLALTAALRKCVEALELISNEILRSKAPDAITPTSEEIYNDRYRKICISREALTSLSESFKEMK